ncbi:MAG: anti-sigma factor family protein [Spirochaetaceae bacterium]
MSRKYEVLSAYLDGELDSHTARKVEARLREDEEYRRVHDSLLELRETLDAGQEPDYVASAERVWERLEASLTRKRREPTPFWKRQISVPLPFAAAAAALFFSIAGIAIYLAGTPKATSREALAGMDPEELDITIQIDEAQARELIGWLEERKDVQQVTIQLPETPRFELIGEPVLVPASDARGPLP